MNPFSAPIFNGVLAATMVTSETAISGCTYIGMIMNIELGVYYIETHIKLTYQKKKNTHILNCYLEKDEQCLYMINNKSF